jgi:hypothetical protein
VILSLTLISPSDSIRPRSLSPKVIYLFVTTGMRLENCLLSPVICLEQPESINQMFFKVSHLKFKNEHVSEQTTQH